MSQRSVVEIPTSALRRVAVGIVVLIILAALAAVAWQQRDRLGVSGILSRGLGDQIDSSTYQAVFLAGGQVYFGKLSTHGDDYLLLNDVFYLSADAGATPDQGQLVKRGSELHGPTDPMIIASREVLFIENLKPDSEVSKAIARYRSGAPGATTAPATRLPATATPTPRPSPSPTR